jgi:ABC-2 type transport system ATP-binding protein
MELRIQNLSKRYSNGVQALDHVSLTIGAGMFGLLGPNGAGKSTLMRIIATLQEADSGSVTLDGDFASIDALNQKDQLREVLGYLPQEFGLYPKVTALQLLDHFAQLKGISSGRDRQLLVEALLRQTNLWEARNQKLGTFSGGMKQRFGIAQALLANPKLIIVDEPTAGLDPAERNRFLNLLSSLARDVIVILSTHIVEDVRELCPRMAIISNGRLVLEGSPEEALERLRGGIFSILVHTEEEFAAVSAAHKVVSTKLLGGAHEIRIHSDSAPGDGFRPVDPALEDVYFLTLNSQSVN